MRNQYSCVLSVGDFSDSQQREKVVGIHLKYVCMRIETRVISLPHSFATTPNTYIQRKKWKLSRGWGGVGDGLHQIVQCL